MNKDFPEYEYERYKAILNKDFEWLNSYLDIDYLHFHSNGEIENKEIYLKNLSSKNIKFLEMIPKEWKIRKKADFVFITGLSNFKLFYLGNFLNLNLIYHSIWKIEITKKCFSWQATKAKN